MRVDHNAYQRATRVASFGLLMQIVIGLTLLIFGITLEDTAFIFGSLYSLSGVIVWVALIVIFYQHKLEKLETLEEDELASTRGESVMSMFEEGDADLRVAARRLVLMHKWLMPIISLVLAGLLGLLAWIMLRFMGNLSAVDMEQAETFAMTDHRGWAISLCLGASVAAFIFSRFVAGMAKQPAWQNLRGGAAYMVGTSLLCLTIAIGIGFRFFDNEAVMLGIGYAIPIFTLVLATEIILNFILNLYRPRIPGEVPRPAFDSKTLSLFAAPDNLIRSINEAVNYQFGFDVTSTWGYQLLLRSFAWLIGVGVISMILLSTIVIVEPHQQAVKLSGGRIVGDVHESGIMWKLPWPLQSAEVHDVRRIRTLNLTARKTHINRPLVKWGNLSELNLWSEDLKGKTNIEMIPFIVGASDMMLQEDIVLGPISFSADDLEVPENEMSHNLSLIQSEIVLEYRIKAKGGLRDYLKFAPDIRQRRKELDERERVLQSLALSVVTDHLSHLSLDEALALGRSERSLSEELKQRIQQVLDDPVIQSGIEIVSVNLPLLRPIQGTHDAFEDWGHARQERLIRKNDAQVQVRMAKIGAVGDENLLDDVMRNIEVWERLRREQGSEARATIEQRVMVEQLLMDGGGQTAFEIAIAQNSRWVKVLEARTKASRIRGQIPAYHAAPALYRQREIMRVLSSQLTFARKYVVAIDPSRFSIDLELKELNPILNFADSLGEPIE